MNTQNPHNLNNLNNSISPMNINICDHNYTYVKYNSNSNRNVHCKKHDKHDNIVKNIVNQSHVIYNIHIGKEIDEISRHQPLPKCQTLQDYGKLIKNNTHRTNRTPNNHKIEVGIDNLLDEYEYHHHHHRQAPKKKKIVKPTKDSSKSEWSTVNYKK
jgi:hypothetical protein